MKALNFLKLSFGIVAVTLLAASCDNSSTIGASLVEDQTEIVLSSDFSITGHSVANPYVQSRSITQVLGRLNAKGYGNFSSDFVTQFMPASSIDTEAITLDNIDSLKLIFFIPNGSYVGDSIAPMGLEVYRLNRQLPAPIYSNFSPADYYNPADKLAEKIYNCNALGQNDTIQSLTYRYIDVTMPISLAYELYNLYQTNPEAYALPSNFAKYFPGIYVKTNYGNGRVVEITSTMMRLYYHTTETDDDGETTVTSCLANLYAVTPEIVINNNFSYEIDSTLQQRIDNGEPIVVAPVGRDVEFEFPLNDVIRFYNENRGTLSVINTLSLTIPVEEITNDYGIAPPENLLLILSKNKDKFFYNNELNDDVTSFYATYDSTNKCYSFTGLRAYLLDMLSKSNITADDYTFTLTPVTVDTETNTSSSSYYYYYSTSTTYVSAINPYIGAPTMAKLNLSDATVSFAFSKQTVY